MAATAARAAKVIPPTDYALFEDAVLRLNRAARSVELLASLCAEQKPGATLLPDQVEAFAAVIADQLEQVSAVAMDALPCSGARHP